MARIRTIKPEFFDDPDVAELSMEARLLFIGLWTQADREGRLEDDMRRLKVKVFPYDPVDVESLAVELHGGDMIRRYQDSDGKRYIWITKFTTHQRPHPKEPESRIPAYSDDTATKHGEPCLNKPDRVDTGYVTMDTGYVMELGDESSATSAKPDESPALLTFTTIGPVKSWPLTQLQIDEWATAYPGLDCLGECRKAQAWLGANQKKTAKGMPRFLVSWLGRAVDKPSAQPHRMLSRAEQALESL
jgi:translation initiation factor IF-1